MEDPATAKGLVEREITRIVTPGTVTESCMLDESRNNYIGCIYSEGGRLVRFAGCSSLIGTFQNITVTGATTWSLTGDLA